MNRLKVCPALLFLAVAGAARAAEPPPAEVVPLFRHRDDSAQPAQWGVGPIDSRDPWPLALAHFTIPVESTDTTRAGRARVSTVVTWGTSQVYSATGETVDAETILARVQGRFGILDRWEIAGELPF